MKLVPPAGLTEAQSTTLQEGISQIMNSLEHGLSYVKYMELYTIIYNHCTSVSGMTGGGHYGSVTDANTGINRGANLRGRELYDYLRSYLSAHLTAKINDMRAEHGQDLMSCYTVQWEKYTMASTLIHHIFRYLNRHWVRREIDEGHQGVYDIYTLSLVTWKEIVFTSLVGELMTQTKELVQKHRVAANGASSISIDQAETKKIKCIVDSFVALGLDVTDNTKVTLEVYKTYFEEPFLAFTKEFYDAESAAFLAEYPMVDYLVKAEQRLAEEEARVALYLHPSTLSPLIKCTETCLVREHATAIQAVFKDLLALEKSQDLLRMYNLLSRFPDGTTPLKTQFETFVLQAGLQAILDLRNASTSSSQTNLTGDGADTGDPASKKSPDETDSKDYIECLIRVHEKYASMVQVAFKGDAGFVASLDKACREFVNRNSACSAGSNKSPELLAKFCDSVLRKSNKTVEETSVEDVLSKVMIVFKYVEDKDVFQKFYSKHLAKRLVNEMSASDDAESAMISNLKEACGFEYTQKLQRMFQDMGLSKDLNDLFQNQLSAQDQNMDFRILVLNTASWPLSAPSSPFNTPLVLLKQADRFSKFYQNKHSGRKLTWLTQLCKGELRSLYTKNAYTFLVSTYQMAILLMYNTADVLTGKELLDATALEPTTLTGALSIFVKAKVVLESKGATLESTTYTLNLDFKSKKIRMNLNLPIKSEVRQEVEETHKTVEEDRRLLIQAAIVRIMKTRKTLKHVALIQEVLAQLQTRFKPQIPDIKKSIDILLEKEYIERADGQKDTYNYLA